MLDATSAPFGSLCAIHPERVATRTCRRCGNFMCVECSISGSSDTCPKCRELAGSTFPFSRDDFDFTRLWEYVFEAWKRELWMLVVCGLIVFGASSIGGVIGMMVNVVGTGVQLAIGKNSQIAGLIVTIISQVISQLISTVLQGIAIMGLVRVCLDVLEGKKADPARMFTQLKKAGDYIVQFLIIVMVIAIPLLMYFGVLLAISMAASGAGFSSSSIEHMVKHPGPGIFVFLLGTMIALPAMLYVSLPFSLASLELVYSGCSGIEALRRSWVLADGFRVRIFGYGMIGGLVLMAGLIVCCVGILASFPLQQLLLVGVFLSLRTGSSLPAPERT